MPKSTYEAAGVNLDAGKTIKRRIRTIVSSTHGPQVLGGVGAFGAMYELSGYREPVLVSSTDPVGTKLKVAAMLGRYDTIGEDLVNACVNDVIVCGAKPIFFLDYIVMDRLKQDVVEDLVSGMARACQQVGCALIGGETAEMPGVFADSSFDLSGFAVGVVEKSAMLGQATVREGDVLLGVPSNGLHTNGYSLVRHVLGLDDDPSPLDEFHPELGLTLGEALLVPHRSYYHVLRAAFSDVKGIAHITGGGLPENVPRVLPEGLAARFDTATWPLPPIFPLLQKMGDIDREEMYRVFNMGLGMVIVCDKARATEVLSALPEARLVGEVVKGNDARPVILE